MFIFLSTFILTFNNYVWFSFFFISATTKRKGTAKRERTARERTAKRERTARERSARTWCAS
jgi:hypothetical protein